MPAASLSFVLKFVTTCTTDSTPDTESSDSDDSSKSKAPRATLSWSEHASKIAVFQFCK